MTGGEVAGAGAVAKAVGETIKTAMPGAEDRAQFREVTRGSKATEVAAYSRADRIAIAQMALTKLYAPLAKWVGYKSAYFDEGQFAEDMAEKLADVPPERLVTPTPIVAAQAMEGLGFSLDEPDLKEMYLNLLATASDSARTEAAHPSFAQIIKQLSGKEAGLLLDALQFPQGLALVEVRLNTTDPEGWRALHRHVVGLTDKATGEPREVEHWAMYVDNWVRLGLVNVTHASILIAEHAYDWTESRPEVIRARARYDRATDGTVGVDKGILFTTALGVQFAAAVRDPGTSLPESDADPN